MHKEKSKVADARQFRPPKNADTIQNFRSLLDFDIGDYDKPRTRTLESDRRLG